MSQQQGQQQQQQQQQQFINQLPQLPKPRIGGLLHGDTVAWTGGEPNYDGTAHAMANPRMKSALCKRYEDGMAHDKAYTKHLEPPANLIKFERGMGPDKLRDFAAVLSRHAARCGMDTIMFVQAISEQKMLNLFDHYPTLSLDHVVEQIEDLQTNHFDE